MPETKKNNKKIKTNKSKRVRVTENKRVSRDK